MNTLRAFGFGFGVKILPFKKWGVAGAASTGLGFKISPGPLFNSPKLQSKY